MPPKRHVLSSFPHHHGIYQCICASDNERGSAEKFWGTWYFTSAHNCDTILIINYLARTRSVASLPCKIVLEDLIQHPSKKPCYHQGGRRETASGFYPWGKMDSPRERVVEGLCGWWHGNSFPMTQNAQSHRQMRSIPRCSKAVFYVFVFDSIHDSATLHNLSPGIFHWTLTSNF